MLTNETERLDVEAWKAHVKKVEKEGYYEIQKALLAGVKAAKGSPAHEAYSTWTALVSERDQQHGGQWEFYPSALYALRAHLRGRVHFNGWELEQQEAFLTKTAPLWRHFIVLRAQRDAPEEVRTPA